MQNYYLPSIKEKHSVARLMSKLLFLCLSFFASHTSFAKEPFSFRKLLNHIHISVSTGYGKTAYCNQVVGRDVVMFKDEGQFYIRYKAEGHDEPTEFVYLVRWFEGPYVLMKAPADPAGLPDKDKVTVRAKFTETGNTFPITLSGHVEVLRKMRIGLGGTLLINRLESLKFVKKDEDSKEDLGSYVPKSKQHYCVRPFVLLGYKFVETSALSLLLDLNLGVDFTYAKLSDPGYLDLTNRGGVQNIGLTLEGKVSEYCRMFGRISYEQKDVIDTLTRNKLAVVLERSSMLFQLGMSFNCPEVPRCPLPDCKVEVKHNHGGKAYRGVSIFTGRSFQGRRLYKK